MALDPKYFSLSCAMDSAWSDPSCLSADQKALIASCVRAKGNLDQPTSEDDLDILHLAVLACDFLSALKTKPATWLTQHGMSFPAATQTYLSRVAWHFHKHQHQLPQGFLEPLIQFIKETRSHIATLNYDNLLPSKAHRSGNP
jgi:hypothetical protein